MDNNNRRPVYRSTRKNARGKRGKQVLLILLVLVVLIASGIYLGLRLTGNIQTSNTENNGGSSSNIWNNKNKEEVIPVATANILSTGDILIHDPILKNAKNSDGSYDFTKSFVYVREAISKADFAVCNLEVTLGGESKGYSSYPLFNTPDSILDALRYAGFDLLLTANNHAYDSGLSGLKRTADTIAQNDLHFTGSRSSTSDKLYKVVDVNGIKIGMLNYTYETTTQTQGRKALNGNVMEAEANNLINTFNYDKLDEFYQDVETKMSSMKKDGAEVVMLYLHWGDEYQLTPNSYQKTIAKKMCELGVDVLIGGHPHVVQPVETLKSETSDHKMLCIYSTGNALSNQRIAYMGLKTGHTEDGIFFNTTFTKYSDGTIKLTEVSCTPTWINVAQVGSKSIHQIVPIEQSTATGTQYGLSGSAIQNSQKSYERTVALVGGGIADFNQSVTE